MKKTGVIFTTQLVKATLEDRKTQTRRVINKKYRFNEHPENYKVFYQGRLDDDFPGIKTDGFYCQFTDIDDDENFYEPIKCPYGKIGDRLYVRETWTKRADGCIAYKAGPYPMDVKHDLCKWKSPRYMFKKDARIWLEITNIRVERVHDITNEDALAEGTPGAWIISSNDFKYYENPNKHHVFFFQRLWIEINQKRGYGWDVNPWIWVIEFKVIEK
jgi:hypothetical protein